METIDDLPPESRFLLRAMGAGLAPAEAAALLGLAEGDALKRLRGVATREGLALPASSEGSAALLAALAPLREAAALPPVRKAGTACPSADVIAVFAARRLAGPLLLATAEHLADCPRCLAHALATDTATAGNGPEGPVAPPRRPRRTATIAVVIALLLGALLVFGLL